MKTGEQKIKEKQKPGFFYVHENHDWIIGGKVTDERVHLKSESIRPYQVMRLRPKSNRFF